MQSSNDKLQEFAIICPGQGSQTQAMLRDFVDNFPIVKQTFEQASDYLHYDLWDLILNNPDDKLNLTQYTQVALLTSSICLWRLWQQEIEAMPTSVSGHSLGEYSALTIAEVLSFEDAVNLVNLRGNLMANLGEKTPGAMAAIIGLDANKVQELCEQITQIGNLVEAVNFNSKEQTVIAGSKIGVNLAVEQAKSSGAKIASVLAVSVAAHSSLMKDASLELSEAMTKIEFNLPKFKFYQNVTGEEVKNLQDLKQNLSLQLYSPVKWQTIIENIKTSGISSFVELGAGKVLSGLNRRIDKSLQTFTSSNLQDWNKLVENLKS